MTTMLETLNETAAAYTSKTRATEKRVSSTTIISERCHYFFDGRCCSVGRCLEDPGRFEDTICGVDTLNDRYTLESILKPEYRGFPLNFWAALQNLHDRGFNWDENGLSDWGKRAVGEIKLEFNL